MGKAFIHLGLRPGHGVGIIGFNSPEWFFAGAASISIAIIRSRCQKLFPGIFVKRWYQPQKNLLRVSDILEIHHTRKSGI